MSIASEKKLSDLIETVQRLEARVAVLEKKTDWVPSERKTLSLPKKQIETGRQRAI